MRPQSHKNRRNTLCISRFCNTLVRGDPPLWDGRAYLFRAQILPPKVREDLLSVSIDSVPESVSGLYYIFRGFSSTILQRFPLKCKFSGSLFRHSAARSLRSISCAFFASKSARARCASCSRSLSERPRKVRSICLARVSPHLSIFISPGSGLVQHGPELLLLGKFRKAVRANHAGAAFPGVDKDLILPQIVPGQVLPGISIFLS